MKRNCQLYQWYQNNPFVPSRRVFEHGSTTPVSEDVDDMAETMRKPTLHEDESAPITVRSAVSETFEKKETPEEEIKRLKSELQEKDERIAELKDKLIISETNSITDHMTGAHNRRYLEKERLPEEISKINRSREAKKHPEEKQTEHAVSLLFIDIDKFKKVNEGLGHLFGDEVIKELVNILNTMFRPEDTISRWGGEEFIIMMPNDKVNTAREDAKTVAERARKTVEAELIEKVKNHCDKFKIAKDDVKKFVDGTISVGVSTYTSNDEELSQKELIEYADSCVRQAKKTGRNKVMVYDATN